MLAAAYWSFKLDSALKNILYTYKIVHYKIKYPTLVLRYIKPVTHSSNDTCKNTARSPKTSYYVHDVANPTIPDVIFDKVSLERI